MAARSAKLSSVYLWQYSVRQVLARVDAHVLVADVHDLVALAHEVHLDAALVLDPHREMLERIEVEVRAELAVHVPQGVDD